MFVIININRIFVNSMKHKIKFNIAKPQSNYQKNIAKFYANNGEPTKKTGGVKSLPPDIFHKYKIYNRHKTMAVAKQPLTTSRPSADYCLLQHEPVGN